VRSTEYRVQSTEYRVLGAIAAKMPSILFIAGIGTPYLEGERVIPMALATFQKPVFLVLSNSKIWGRVNERGHTMTNILLVCTINAQSMHNQC
jgi:hypothetical protein